MMYAGFGDLAQSFQLRRDNARLNTDLARLANELASGRRSTIGTGTANDVGALASLERDISALRSYAQTADEAAVVADAAQSALGRISDGVDMATAALLKSANEAQPFIIDQAAREAHVQFGAAIAALNVQAAGRSIFAGQAFDGPATVNAETILADLTAAVAAETTAAGVSAIVDAYFAPGGDFETIAYQGEIAEAPVRLGNGETVETTLLATDARISAVLAPLAKAALLVEGALGADLEEQRALADSAGASLLSAQQDLTEARAAVGSGEAIIARSAAQIAADQTATELARNRLVDIDPFETATRLRELEVQLQTLYTITGRLSGLSLTNFLR